MLAKVKVALRIASATTAFDTEITTLINAAKAELIRGGMLSTIVDDTDNHPDIAETIIAYCKARFGNGNNSADADRWEQIYRDDRDSLMVHKEYRQ